MGMARLQSLYLVTQHKYAITPCLNLISVALQLLDFFLQVRLVLLFLVYVVCVVDLCRVYTQSAFQPVT